MQVVQQLQAQPATVLEEVLQVALGCLLQTHLQTHYLEEVLHGPGDASDYINRTPSRLFMRTNPHHDNHSG